MTHPTPIRRRARRLFAPAVVILALAALCAAAAASAAAPWMYDEKSYDVLTYSAWGRANQVSGAQCTGTGAAGKRFMGATHGAFRCDVQVGEAPAGTVTVKVLGPESLRVTAAGKFKPDRGIGAVPGGTPIMQDFDAVIALQKNPWTKAHKVVRVLCYGIGNARLTDTSEYYYAFSCATFGGPTEARGAQVLVTANGKNAVKIVRTLVK